MKNRFSAFIGTVFLLLITNISYVFGIQYYVNKTERKDFNSKTVLPETDPSIRELADKAGILIGVRAFLRNDTQKTIVEREFNTSTRTCYPGEINTKPGQHDLDSFNEGVNWLYERGMKPMHHMLFGPSQYEAAWVREITSVSELDSLMKDRIRTIMESNDNASKVNVWNVVNEALSWNKEEKGNYFTSEKVVWVKMGYEDDKSGLTGEDKINDKHPIFIRKAFEYASRYAKGKLELRDNGCETPGRKALAFYQLVRHLQNSGVKIDGIGFQCHYNIEGEGVLNPQGLAAEIRKYRNIGLEVYLTEVDFGSGKTPWTRELAEKQKNEYKKIITVALQEGVKQVHFWGLRDADENWRRDENPLLFDKDFAPKPAYFGVKEALAEFLDQQIKSSSYLSSSFENVSSDNMRELSVRAQVPQLGAEVWLEPQYSAAHIDSLFKLLADNNMPVARLFVGLGGAAMYDNAFASAEKYGVKIQATLSASERPNSEDDLVRNAQNIKRIVSRYKNSPALETWWLMNEPGNGPSSSVFAVKLFREWLGKKYGDIKKFNTIWRRNYNSFEDVQYNEAWASSSNLSSTVEYLDWFEFSAYRLTWILQWIANEVSKEDTIHQFHVNPHGIFNNLIQYEFPEWRNFLSSLGASIHPAWHFGLLNRNQFAMGIAATCDIIKGGSEPNPFWVSELQSGNNTWSGSRPLGPESEDIAQWTWISIGCGAEKVIYWMLNNRSRGGESGEWSMLDFQGNPSDRLKTASEIAQTIAREKDFFIGAKPLERKVVILLSPESTLILARKAAKDGLAGRSANAHILSALSYYKTLSELGIPAIFKYTNDFDWENKTGCLAIFPNAVAVPRQVVKRAETFVANGNKLIIDGLTGYFDENEVNVLQTGFFFEKLCGATFRDIRTEDNLFTTRIDNISNPLPVHLWQTEVLNHTAQVIGREGGRITAVRNKFGKGEVIWLPMLAGLGAWLDTNDALSELLKNEITSIASETPIIFKQKTDNVIMQILKNGDSYVSIVTNGTDKIQEVALQLNKKLIPKVIFDTNRKENIFIPSKIIMQGRQTVVIRWTSAN